MHVYFLGICGTAMGNIAVLLKELGNRVSGSDRKVYPPMSDVLRRNDIEILEGFDVDRLVSLDPDLVVVGNSTVRGNEEFEWLLAEKKIPFTSLPALIHDQLLKNRLSIVVAGTHGKTTTATLTTFLLRENGVDPGYFIGGVPHDLPSGASNGSPDAPFVIEGDEYDSALFDKRSKFIHYAPNIAIVNNIEFDHADIFRDLADVQRSFNHFLRIVPDNGYILLNGDDPAVAALAPVSWGTTYRVGTGAGNDLQIADFTESSAGAEFSLIWQGKLWEKVRMPLGGIFNARNAAMAALAGALAEVPERVTDFKLSALADFRGVKRRQERLFSSEELLVIEDFGHHPTALKQALQSFRTAYPDRKLTAIFEPRSNTSRRNIHQKELIESLCEADEIYLGPVSRPEMLSDRERLDLEAVTDELKKNGRFAAHFSTNRDLLEELRTNTFDRDRAARLVVFFSNGSFDGIIADYVSAAESRISERD